MIDASLDPAVYLSLAAERGWTIRHVLDTHIHADHLSRSRNLARDAGATLWLPEQRRARFPHQPLRDGAQVRFGDATLHARHTPGHTLESTTYLIGEHWLLTGDTLFPAAVGRPDLEASVDEARERALLLHASLRRLFGLEPERLVMAAHASQPVAFDNVPVTARLCAARDAVALPEDAMDFARRVLDRLPPTPPNHRLIVGLNESGELPDGDPTDLEAGANRCAIA